ncbi:Clp protease N-terminal domain-containing protein [Streptomyces lonegramiae]|uniref:Clp protease N-terminal domain-containing protein n=1 Tax=Streptomyces lonegramiae TaxID=3075524 RepID=A0ABU2XLR2_9ACTN|nr:Clp protease N-terminal domain-containing protein [Streptomyces sp. DSM 41529]MDT0546859.1 Clp protease N-terminal domain-containing protein [Streptomyces sp. DSM 41529]
MLLGLARIGRGVAAAVLDEAGLDADTLREAAAAPPAGRAVRRG